MLIIILISIFVCALLHMILLGWSFLGVLACVAAVAYMVLWFLKRKEKWIGAVCVAVAVVGLFGICFTKRDSYILEYGSEMQQVNRYMDKYLTEEALDILEELEEDYGLTDEIIMARVMCCMIDREPEEALEWSKSYSGKTEKEYYSMMESIYKELDEDGEKPLQDLYIEAAKNWPNWLEMQMSAGMVQLERKEYSSAMYYFRRAYNLDVNSGMPSYLLGMTCYYMGDYKNCLFFYNLALEKGVSDDIKEAIAGQVAFVQEGE